jgi:hypothetical protein
MAYTPHGGEFRVNTQTSGDQSGPAVAVLDDGSRVVVWTDGSHTLGDSDGASVKGQRYDSSGVPIGGEFLVNTQTIGGQVAAFVRAVNGGGFVVVWNDGSGVSDGSFSGVDAQVFDSAGNRVGGELHVNTQGYSTQAPTGIARLSNGGFVITWYDLFGGAVKQQIYDESCTRVG